MYYINNAHLQLPVEFGTFSYSLMHIYSIHQITYIFRNSYENTVQNKE